MRYQVKWKVHKATIYGIYHGTSCFYDGKEIKSRPGYVFVDDAIFPTFHEVEEKNLVDIPFDYKNPGGNEYEKFVEAEFKKAQRRSKKAGKGLKVGKLFSVAVADGGAWYVVLRVMKKSVRVEWRGFGADRYHDQVLGSGGAFPKEVVARLVGHADWLEDTFGKAKVKKIHGGT